MGKHALERARERGVGISEIKETIERGAKHLQGEKVVSMYRHIKVIFKKIKSKFFILSVMIRSEKNGK